MEKRRKRIVDAVAVQAIAVLRNGSRFQIRRDVIGSEDQFRRFLSGLAVHCGFNVRASQYDGLVTLYSDESDLDTEVVVATVDIV